MLSWAYIRLVWKNNRTLAIFSALLITLFQFLILYLVTTFDTQAMLGAVARQMPPMMRAFMEDSVFSMLNFDGAAAFGFNHPIVLTLLVLNAITIPGHHITRELESGTLELVLAHPLGRKRLLISLWSSGVMILFFILIVALAGSLTSIILFHELTGIIFLRMLGICINSWLLMILIFTYTMLIAVFSKVGVKAGNISAALTFFFYLLYYLSEIWQKISFIKPYNIFSYFEPQKIMTGNSHYLTDITVLAVLIALLYFFSQRRFMQRDIP